jgi:hypothetical protein
VLLCLYSLTSYAQELPLSSVLRNEAEENALLIPEINNCCQFDEVLLQINFGAPDASWEGCAVIAGEAVFFYPADGQSGSAEICVTFPETNFNGGQFSVFDTGDFTNFTVVNGVQQLCSNVSYPVEEDIEKDPGFLKLKFYAIPERIDANSNPTVENIGGSISLENSSSEVSECNCDNEIGLSFESVTSPVASGIGAYFIEDGANISDLLQNGLCNFSCFPTESSLNRVGRVLIFGELNIDQNYTFGEVNNPLRSSITLGPGSKINVKDGATLELIDTEVRGCFEMWEAINVEPGGRLIIRPGVRRSLVSGGEFGIVVHDDGTAILDGVIFEANNVSVTTPDDGIDKFPDINILGSIFTFGEGPALERIIPSPFLLPPYFGEVPRAGVELFDVAGGLVTDRGLTRSTINIYENLRNGIIFNRSTATVTDSRFLYIEEIKNKESGNGILIKEPDIFSSSSNFNYISVSGTPGATQNGVSFLHSSRGIKSENGQGLNVNNALFSSVNSGLFAQRGGRTRFNNNDVHSFFDGIRIIGQRRNGGLTAQNNAFTADANEESREASAIRIEGLLGSRIERYRIWENTIELTGAKFGLYGSNARRIHFLDNEITWGDDLSPATGILLRSGALNVIKGNYLLGNTTALQESQGIDIDMSGRSLISCNTVESISTGMRFLRLNQSTRLRGNIIKDATTGLLVGESTLANELHAIGRQVHAGNKWLGSFGDFGANYSGLADNAAFSQFIVDETDGNGILPPSWTPPGNNFIRNIINDSTPFYDNCPAGTPPGFNAGGKDPLTDGIIRKTINWSGNYTAEGWIADSRLLREWEAGKINSLTYPELNTWLANPGVTDIQTVEAANRAVDLISESQTLDSLLFEQEVDLLEKSLNDYRSTAIALLKAGGTDATLEAEKLQLKTVVLSSRNNLTSASRLKLVLVRTPAARCWTTS